MKSSAFKIKNANDIHKEKLTKAEKFAVWLTNKVGTIGFFFIIFLWTSIWLLWNTLAPQHLRFDPYPAFVLWLFISNMIQIFLMPLIMVGQNLQGKHAEIRAENDYLINLKSEEEIREINSKLINLENKIELLQSLLKTKN